MESSVNEPEKIWYLEMLSPEELHFKKLPPEVRLVKLEIPFPALNCFFYAEVGKNWKWTERLKWSREQWVAWIEEEKIQTWMLLYRGTPAGYFELNRQDGDVELAHFGLLPPFYGKGLGGGLLSAATKEAWGMEVRRVWLHTCDKDHPHALKNYQARGFRIYRETVG